MRARFFSLKAIATAGFLALAGFTVVDCGNAVAACDAKCDCEKCETSVYNACLATGESDQHTALEAGCTKELDDLQGCEATTGVCQANDKGSQLVTDCKTQQEKWKICVDTKKK